MKEIFNDHRKWLVVAILLALFFLFVAGINWYNSTGIYMMLIESLFVSFFLMMWLSKSNTLYEFIEWWSSKEPNKNSIAVVVPIVFLVLFGLTLTLYWSNVIKNKLKDHGVQVNGVITNGFEKTTKSLRRGTSRSYSLTVEFTTKEGKKVKAVDDADQDVYNNVYQGAEVPIIYLPENPEIYTIAVGSSAATEFKTVSNRELWATDIVELVNMSSDRLTQLKQINVDWKLMPTETKSIFYNSITKEMLSIIPNEQSALYIKENKYDIQYFLNGDNSYEKVKHDTILNQEKNLYHAIDYCFSDYKVIYATPAVSNTGKALSPVIMVKLK